MSITDQLELHLDRLSAEVAKMIRMPLPMTAKQERKSKAQLINAIDAAGSVAATWDRIKEIRKSDN